MCVCACVCVCVCVFVLISLCFLCGTDRALLMQRKGGASTRHNLRFARGRSLARVDFRTRGEREGGIKAAIGLASSAAHPSLPFVSPLPTRPSASAVFILDPSLDELKPSVNFVMEAEHIVRGSTKGSSVFSEAWLDLIIASKQRLRQRMAHI